MGGILVLKETASAGTTSERIVRELGLPIFHEDRRVVSEVLAEAMAQVRLRAKKPCDPAGDFYTLVNSLGRQRTGSPIFIGPESSLVPPDTLDSLIRTKPYVFTADFENGALVRLGCRK